MLAQLINWLILAIDIVVTLLVGRDARRRGLGWPYTIMWVAISFCLFPIGIGLYFWLGRPHSGEARGAKPLIKNTSPSPSIRGRG
jgi:uncharacterized membrane protein